MKAKIISKLGLVAILVGLTVSCEESKPIDLPLEKEVKLDGLGLSIKIPSGWSTEVDMDYDNEFVEGYIIKDENNTDRIKYKINDACETESSIDAFTTFINVNGVKIDAKNIPEGEDRTEDKLTVIDVVKNTNGTNGFTYKNEFTTRVDGVEEFVVYNGMYTFYITNEKGMCIKIENTYYNNEGETLPTDLKIIESTK